MKRHSQTLSPATTCTVYHGYLIRWSAMTHSNGANRVWIEAGNAFIGWAIDEADAKRTIDMLGAR